VVGENRDNGYHATSTLAGTRLNTRMKDLGGAISVYTKQFLEDLGATNSNELLIYATGMEAGGPGGNFAGVNTDVNAVELVGSAVRENPQTSSTRGLASPNFTRSFFNTGIPFDSYNTDTVTVNRGPNAMLFGVGSAAGMVDTSLIRSNLQRDAHTVVVRYGNNHSLRESVDLNRVLIPKKLGVRIAGLYGD
jgi:outer membrane receptor protein involved in Fe transport